MHPAAPVSGIVSSRLFGRRLFVCVLGLAAIVTGVPPTAVAQTPPAKPENEKPVTLPEFTVRDVRSGAYNAMEAVSLTRISIPIQDLAQTVSVVTRELVDDTQGFRMLDVAKFLTPLQESSPSGGDRYSIRGFQTSQRFIDGVNVSGLDGYNMPSDTTNVERLEIIKGPNAILVPGGGFGGIMNQITKSPKFENFTALSVRWKTYLGSEASVDANRSFQDGKSAARVVFSLWDSKGYANGDFRKGYLLAPSFTHVFSGGAQITLKVETLHNEQGAGQGVSIDPAVGTSVGGNARKNPLLPRNNMWGPTGDNRFRWETRFYSDLNFKVGDNIASRLWLMADTAERNDHGAPGGGPQVGNQGNRDPLTGAYVPFMSFKYTAATNTETATPIVPSTSTIFTRTNQANRLVFNEVHLKNDYASEYNLGAGVKGTTIAGLSANYQRVAWKNWNGTRPAVDYATGQRVGPDDPLALVIVKDKIAAQEDMQVFAYQRINLFNDQVILSGGASQFWGVLERLDNSPVSPPLLPSTRNAVTDANWGVIYKPLKQVSLFAGFNRVGGALPSSIQAGDFATNGFKIGVGSQWEYGVKTSFLNNRITTSASYFRISQSNVTAPNSVFATDPTQPQFLFFDLRNHGLEVEANAAITKEFMLIGNYTHMHMRDTYGIPQRMVADNAAALFAKYTFAEGPAKGLGFSFGWDYMDQVAGDQTTLATAAGVTNQPSFYLAPRTLLEAGVSYKHGKWSVGVMVNNLTNKDYILASLTRTTLVEGDPRSYSVTFDHRF